MARKTTIGLYVLVSALFLTPLGAGAEDLAGPWISVGAGLTMLNIEGHNVLAANISQKFQFCPTLTVLIELGQGIMGWRAGYIRFSGLSTILVAPPSSSIPWCMGFGTGDYQCPSVGEEIYGALLLGVAPTLHNDVFGDFPGFVALKIAKDRGLRRPSNLAFMLAAGGFPIAWQPEED